MEIEGLSDNFSITRPIGQHNPAGLNQRLLPKGKTMFVTMLFPLIGCAVTGCGLKGDLEHPAHTQPIQTETAFHVTPATLDSQKAAAELFASNLLRENKAQASN